MTPSILILIIYSENLPQYKIMHDIWEKYMNEYPEVLSYFLKCDPSIEENIIEKDNIILTKYNETFLNITNKTIDSMDYLLKKFPSITHIIRTNISSFINIPKLIEMVKELPQTKLYAGRHYYNHWEKDIRKRSHFVHGSNIVFSRDVAEYLIDIIKSKKVKTDIIDDFLFGKILYEEYGILVLNSTQIENGLPNNFDEIIKNSEYNYHFRCKNRKNRYLDCIIQLELAKRFYGNLDFSDIKFNERQKITSNIQISERKTTNIPTRKTTQKKTTEKKKSIHLNFVFKKATKKPTRKATLKTTKMTTRKTTRRVTESHKKTFIKPANNLRIRIKK